MDILLLESCKNIIYFNHMKILLSILLLVSFLYTPLTAVEYGMLFQKDGPLAPDSISLSEGDVFEILSFGPGLGNSDIVLKVYHGDSPSTQLYAASYSTIRNDLVNYGGASSTIFVGPATVVLEKNSSVGTAIYNLTYKLTRASEVEYKQANIVSLPADTVGAGTHEIVVEASDDLQSWTPVHSSSIGGNKAFFRTRVVRTGE
jgi:hypothetical protein